MAFLFSLIIHCGVWSNPWHISNHTLMLIVNGPVCLREDLELMMTFAGCGGCVRLGRRLLLRWPEGCSVWRTWGGTVHPHRRHEDRKPFQIGKDIFCAFWAKNKQNLVYQKLDAVKRNFLKTKKYFERVLKLVFETGFENGFETGFETGLEFESGFETGRVVWVVERSKRKIGSKRSPGGGEEGREPS